MRCKVCNAYIPEGATHCLDCGSQFEDIIVCQHCATELPSHAKFCNRCGKPALKPGEFKKSLESPSSTRAQSNLPGSTQCPRCAGDVPQGTLYCPTCGTNVSRMNEPVESNRVSIVETGPVEKTDSAQPCPRCGTEPRGSGRFCHNCGRFLSSDIEDVICPQCGATNILRYAKCQYCGSDLPTRPKPKNESNR